MKVVLASRSPTRSALLSGAGVAFEALSPGVDEDAVKAELALTGASPSAVAEVLADRKALAIAARDPTLVIGADQTLELGGRLYDKVDTVAAAGERLRLLRGRTHQLHAAVAVARAGEVVWRDLVTVSLTMRAFSDAFLDAYLAQEGPLALGSVGCYRLEGPGAQLFERIEGDYFAILGLPLLSLLEHLRQAEALDA